LGLELGSVSNKVARRSPVPVVVVRGEHDRSAGKEVVVGVDGRPCSRRALRWAADWAKAHDKVLTIVLAWNYLEPQGPDGPIPFESEYDAERAEAVLRSIVSGVLGTVDNPRIVSTTVCDLPARAVLERSTDACLIVMGRDGTAHWAPPDLGATALQVLHHAPCPVAIIPAVPVDRDEA
jgi:nucleotide-binding universal stress UspA family protein